MRRCADYVDSFGNLVGYWFFCLGCNDRHHLGKSWDFNGNYELPTFHPSILTWSTHKGVEINRCHSFVRDGKIQFLGDCHHGMKNTTVDLPDVDIGSERKA